MEREQTGYFIKQTPILDGDIVAQHCQMIDDYTGKTNIVPNRLLVCWNGKGWDVKCLDAMVGYRNDFWGRIPASDEVIGNAVDNPEMIPSEVKWLKKPEGE